MVAVGNGNRLLWKMSFLAVMYIEIRKAGFINKGAELMLRAVMQQVELRCPLARMVMEPGLDRGAAPYINRARLGFYQKASVQRYGIQFGCFANLAPSKLRELFGVVLDRQVDVVLDAAGFAYSDQWGSAPSVELARASKRWRKNGTKIVLLPQAFGPFERPRTRDAVKSFMDCADLVYARDELSYSHLIDVVGKVDKLRTAPDFTNLLEGACLPDLDFANNQICIVPNYRMIDKAGAPSREAYLSFLHRAAKILIAHDSKPFVLVHEGEMDFLLAEEISRGVGGLAIITEPNPIRIKAILSHCRGTIGSRFHGLVSAMSQGVPSLATGWSHKYKMLFHEYGFDEGLIDVAFDDSQLLAAFDIFYDRERNEDVRRRLLARSAELKKASVEMWDEVFALVDECV